MLQNASFEKSADGWRALNLAGAVSSAQHNDATRAHDGSGYLEFSSSQANASMASDWPSSPMLDDPKPLVGCWCQLGSLGDDTGSLGATPAGAA